MENNIGKEAKYREIIDIFASANIGTWRIELVDNEEHKMYVDDTLKRLLGIEKRELTPEKIFDEWFYNITPEAVPTVLSSLERMKQGGNEEATYLWNHPEKGVRYVRFGGNCKAIQGGYSVQGYLYDVDEIERRHQAQTLRLKKALEEKNEYYETLGALGDLLYYSLHVIDLEKDQVYPFTAKDRVKEIVNHRDGAKEMMEQIMRGAISEDCVDRALEFTDLSTLQDRMAGKKIITRELNGTDSGWINASFITMEQDSLQRPTKVIFITRVIEEEMKEREKLLNKSRTDEMTGLLNRRAYEEDLYAHNNVPEEDKFIYVSLDANGLKTINDSIGHAAGDELIIGVAKCMEKSMGPHGFLYRVGGDEFLAVLFLDELEIKVVLADFDNLLENWNGKLIDKLSVSYGWVNKHEFPGASVRQLGSVAEKRMYASKSNYYVSKGVDRRGQQDVYRVLSSLYTKILKINLTDDTYQIINMDVSEKTSEKGFANTISEWLTSFGKSGLVHPDDLDEYLRLTRLPYMKEYFLSGKTSYHIFYRRKFEDGFKRVMMEIVPANDFREDNMSLFLYVKNIDN